MSNYKAVVPVDVIRGLGDLGGDGVAGFVGGGNNRVILTPLFSSVIVSSWSAFRLLPAIVNPPSRHDLPPTFQQRHLVDRFKVALQGFWQFWQFRHG